MSSMFFCFKSNYVFFTSRKHSQGEKTFAKETTKEENVKLKEKKLMQIKLHKFVIAKNIDQ